MIVHFFQSKSELSSCGNEEASILLLRLWIALAAYLLDLGHG
jgi:hypothetical protein